MAEVVKKKEPEREDLGCAGAVVITTAVLAVLGVFYLIAPTGFVLSVGAAGWAAVIWATGWRPRWVRRTANPAPPPAPERGRGEETLVVVVKDPHHPNRWIVDHQSVWMTEEINKEAGTT